MLQELREVFREMLEESGERLVLDAYVPKNGTYRLVLLEEDGIQIASTLEIGYDRKTGTVLGETDSFYDLFRYMDYWSKLVDMNKPVDSKKIIHSNNYLAFFIKKDAKKEGKLTDEILDGYYDTLLHPERKYQKPKARALYQQVEEELGPVQEEMVEQIRQIVKKGEIWEDIDWEQKDYCKIFFAFRDEEKTRQLYEKEGRRYLIPNIYNNNDYNEAAAGGMIGMPNNNLGLNAKKPYLANLNRKISTPYLISQQDALLQMQLFDYLMGFAAKDKVNIYIIPEGAESEIRGFSDKEEPEEISHGYYLRLRKGKELEIRQFEPVSAYDPKLMEPFVLRNVLDLLLKDEEREDSLYNKECGRLWQIKSLIDKIFFDNRMSQNFFADAKDISISEVAVKKIFLENREWLFDWFYKGMTRNIEPLFDRLSWNLVVHSARQGERTYTGRQLNMRWSMLDYFHQNRRMEEKMMDVRERLREHINSKEEWQIVSEDEFYYSIGQMASFLISLSKAKKKSESLINPLLKTKTQKGVKEYITILYKRYNYAMEHNTNGRAQKLLSHIMRYQSEEKTDQEMIIAGFTDDCLIYEKKENGGEKNE